MADALLLLEGSRFWLCDGRGDAVGGTQGLFDSDVRHLSAWRLRLDGEPLYLLSSQNPTLSMARIFGTISGAHVEHNPSITVMREQRVEDALNEKIVLENHSASTRRIKLTLEFEADFKDIFEMKRVALDGGRPNPPSATRTSDSVTLVAREDGWNRSSRVSFDRPPSNGNDCRAEFDVELPPRTRWGLSIVVSSHGSGLDEDHRVPYQQRSVEDGPGHRDDTSPGSRADRPRPLAGVEEFVRAAAEIVSESELVTRTYRQSLVDLAALRFYPERERSTCVLAAGLPWFMALFGRDSLIAAYQALPFAPDLARSTLVTLARYQATEDDPYRDAEPGKILHELRRGKLAALKRIPHTPYYGSHDASPLFLILLDEYERWTGDSALVAELKSSALEALAWIETSGDRDDDGYLEYQTRSPDGLVNHCWKDSWSSIAFAGGELARGPIATCEIQGYAYDARLRMARLCRECWGERELSHRLEADARALKARFNEDFWCADRDHYALALDGDKRRVDSLTSNLGHLLWSGIVADDRSPATVRSLWSPELFNGWGLRTMSVADAPYNPIGYHTGTVWPHDSGLAAEGLRRYGYREEATKLAWALFECAEFFAYRLPEVFGGFARADTEIPVEYPTASRPQAWAAGAPLLALRTMLGLDANGELRRDPVLPDGVRELDLIGLPVG